MKDRYRRKGSIRSFIEPQAERAGGGREEDNPDHARR